MPDRHGMPSGRDRTDELSLPWSNYRNDTPYRMSRSVRNHDGDEIATIMGRTSGQADAHTALFMHAPTMLQALEKIALLAKRIHKTEEDLYSEIAAVAEDAILKGSYP